ncbi:type VII secretion-associated serine protease mycosin [Streptomyces sp. V3I7]|uniref:type VII secretion-associated serine protease mycosin n=1 Tax=Streptomyces sp. V3I7 TaxID=3042278 RepID=UPI002784B594|nr:type VII secretion-associated serine protease mycosin [Streptomyces sp. V3I7]MDQ0990934.1 type VII secretion-associated serine protease mycosin [Streptomyces sp. V3I7]
MGLTRTLRMAGSTAAVGALLFATASPASADQVRNDQWPLRALDAEAVWNVATGKGVTVAVIDDGVDASHPDLKSNVLPGKDFMDGDSDASPVTGEDHGTAMAGVIAGHGHGANGADGVKGLAPQAKILPLRDEGGRWGGLASSIRYAVDHGASVINISQGGPTPAPGGAEREAIQYALQHNVIVVAGAGNDGKSGSEAAFYPASYPGVVSVGAVKKSNEFWEKSNSGANLLLTAPGYRVVSAKADSNGYRMGDGTSDATAYVSAACALLREKFPDLTAGQIVNRLTKTAGLPASAKGLKLPDQKYGYGYIRPLAALQQNIPAGSKNGPLTMPAAQPPAASSTSDDSSGGLTTNSIIALSALGVLGLLIVIGVPLLLVLRAKRRAAEQSQVNQYGQVNQQPEYGSRYP